MRLNLDLAHILAKSNLVGKKIYSLLLLPFMHAGAVHVHVLRSVAIMMMALTDCSQDVCTELSLAGFVAYLIALLSSLDKSAVFGVSAY